MLDMERARMTAEDYRQGNARCEHNPNFLTWRKLEHCRKLRMEDADQTIKNIADVVKWHEKGQTDASGRPLTDEDCFTQIRAEVQAHGLLISSDEEEEEEEEEDDAMDEEQGVFCEACDSYHGQGIVAWYREPFMHDGRNLYSACAVCRRRLNLEDRPVLHW